MQLNPDILLSLSSPMVSQPLSQSVDRGFESHRKCWDFSSMRNRAIIAVIYICVCTYIHHLNKPSSLNLTNLKLLLYPTLVSISIYSKVINDIYSINSIQAWRDKMHLIISWLTSLLTWVMGYYLFSQIYFPSPSFIASIKIIIVTTTTIYPITKIMTRMIIIEREHKKILTALVQLFRNEWQRLMLHKL